MTSMKNKKSEDTKSKLDKLLASIHKAELLLNTPQPSTDIAVLHACPQTLKVASKILDVSSRVSLLCC